MKTTLKHVFLAAFIFAVGSVYGQTVDTMTVFSSKMNKEIKNLLILPKGYDKSSPNLYPVLYLLHGYGGKFFSWNDLSNLPEDASNHNLIIVCPTGENSWYWDSPVNPKSQYETYVSKELVNYVDDNYNTLKSNKGRAIAGLSMGGHGSLWLAINHPDVFGACGSMSGGVDVRPFQNDWDLKSYLGTYRDNKAVWDSHVVMEQLYKIAPGQLSIIIDCGFDDFFFKVNEELHQRLLFNKIPHDYITRPGGHNGKYWENAFDYQLLFFAKFFGR
jgi:S-formylglutathione hydrolase FrmB